jgi:hypothetical protein
MQANGRRVVVLEKGCRARRLPLTFNFVPSSATSSPLGFKHDLDRVKVSMFVSRARGNDEGSCLRTLVAETAAPPIGVDALGVAAPAAFRFFGFVEAEVAPGAGSLAMFW